MTSLSDPSLRPLGELWTSVLVAWNTFPGGRPTDPLPSRLALWLLLVSLIMVIFLAISIVVLNLRNERADRWRKRWSDLWLLQLLDPNGYGRIAPLRRSQQPAFAELWNHVHDSMRGDIRQTLISMSRQSGSVEIALALLQHGRIAQQIPAAMFLGNHLASEAVPVLSSFVSAPDAFLSVACARALVQIDPIGQLPHLLGEFLHRAEWPLPVVHDILSAIDPEILSAHLPGFLLRESPEPSPREIRFLDLVHEDVRTSLIDALFQRPKPLRPETEAALLREIRSPTQLPLVRKGLGSPHWPVVVAALSNLATMGSREDISRLTELLGDKEWWIRYYAARALVALPDMKPIEAELLATRHPDRYGREMLRYALAEMNLK